MKKINFQNIQDALTRNEMRVIMAGSSASCNAKASNCENVQCSCDGSGTCYGYDNYVECICNGATTRKDCPIG